MKGINQAIIEFTQEPFPIWENALTVLLVKDEWRRLVKWNLPPSSYNVANCLFKQPTYSALLCDISNTLQSTYLEIPIGNELRDFYEEHGLSPLSEPRIYSADVIGQLRKSFELLGLIPEVLQCVSTLVRTIQVLSTEDPDFDISYSHPEIPFSIFVSTGMDNSLISTVRLAESILHEAMHLKLTLIEKSIQLIQPGSKEEFYSPWRETHRPLRGVLHGMFVFRAISDFYELLLTTKIVTPIVSDFLRWRIEQICSELLAVHEFPFVKSLTKDGASLSKNLLPSN